MSKRHTDALKAKIQELAALATKTFVTTVPNDVVAPYCVIHPAMGANTQERITGPRISKHPRFTLHIVGSTADQVQVIADLLESKLLPAGRGITLTVAGDVSKPVWFESPIPIQVQTDPQPTVIYQVIECGWTADPA